RRDANVRPSVAPDPVHAAVEPRRLARPDAPRRSGSQRSPDRRPARRATQTRTRPVRPRRTTGVRTTTDACASHPTGRLRAARPRATRRLRLSDDWSSAAAAPPPGRGAVRACWHSSGVSNPALKACVVRAIRRRGACLSARQASNGRSTRSILQHSGHGRGLTRSRVLRVIEGPRDVRLMFCDNAVRFATLRAGATVESRCSEELSEGVSWVACEPQPRP
ncbi:MAG: hypothetical protein QOK16_1364, partial [Solirubrobacteraceae bacterium]|nr:hypothetical protein [Solirubrobacteraceae bacterium]